MLETSDNLADDVRNILSEARHATVRAINTVMVTAYWLIGKRIVLEEQKGVARAGYGDNLLKKLSKELTADFGSGFSYANLYNMRLFYQTYTDSEIFYTLCIKLPWSHNRLIMRVQDSDARKWYLREAAYEQWSVRQLERNINTFYYQRKIETGDAIQCAANPTDINPRQFMKDPYVLEFVGLSQNNEHTEHDLEEALITHMQNFMLELGKGFSFVKRQYRISTETSHFYIDLVFYNYILKCFFLIDLKADKLTHQDVGQMDMYVRMFDEMKRSDEDNPTVGLLLCAERDETVVRYSVLNDSRQLFASKYLPYLPTEEELKRELENTGRTLESKR